MKTVVWIICTLVIFCSAEEESVILELTDETFDDVIKGDDITIVEFYAPWCVFCYELEPTFEEVSRQLKPHGIKMAKVNIESEKKLKTRFDIESLPYILTFKKGLSFKYDGPMGRAGAGAMIEYFLKQKETKWLSENPVLELNNDNFDQITGSTELILVDFFVNECLQCKKLEPIFAAAARKLVKNDPPVLLGSVDVPSNMDTAKKFGQHNYPLLLMFRYGKVYNYTGPMSDEDGIVSFMRKEAGPASVYLDSTDALKEFIRSPDEVVAIGFFSADTSASVLDTFTESGNLARQDLRLGHTIDDAIANHLSFPLNSVVVFHPHHLVSKYEKGYSLIPDIVGETAESLVDTYLQASRPLVGQVTQENFLRAYRHRPLLVAYYEVDWNFDNRKNTKYWHTLLADVAVNYNDRDLVFAIANEDDFPNDIRALGFADWGEDVAVGLFAPGPKKYRLTEELSKDSLTEFLDAFFDNELELYFSSEPPPRKGAGPVRTVVGLTFEKIVYDPTKNVILLVCIPAILECKQAAEWYPKAAKKFHNNKDIVFGEINVDLNDIPMTMFKFDQLPTFFFSPKQSKGEEDLLRIDPAPEDDLDLLLWLRRQGDIRPSKSKKDSKEEL